jgi:CDP-glycerol glycerophosphotransferase (TagB/SpsB family)
MSRLEYLVAGSFLRVLGLLFSLLPLRRDRVVLATARVAALEGNLLHISRAISALRPDVEVVLLLEPYGYGLGAKLAYFGRLLRGMYHLRTAGLFVVDNAYLPVHVAPHRAGTTVVQVWHAAGALKRFGVDTARPPTEPERTFLHRYYDWVVTTGEASRAPWAAALRTVPERVIPLGTPRTDFFFDAAAMAAARERLVAAYPALAGRRVVLYAPTFRGRGKNKRPAVGLDAARLRAALPADHLLVLKSHPNLSPVDIPTSGYDVIVDPGSEINDLLALTDILVTDYSSSIFEYALLRRPLVLLAGDLADYEMDPGLYVDYRAEMIGTQVVDTDGVIAAILEERFDLSGYDAFISRHLGACDGRASARFVERFIGERPA